MGLKHPLPYAFEALCDGWSREMEKIKGPADRMDFMQKALPDLLLNQRIVVRLLEAIAAGEPFVDLKKASLFENEILMYLHPRRIFSIRFILYERGHYTPVHDHNAWGISGTACGTLEVIRYQRTDDGARKGVAHISRKSSALIHPGQVERTLPLDGGIHQTGNPDQDMVVMVSVYGSPVRRPYINTYDADGNTIRRLYPPRLYKKRLAAAALSCSKWT